MSDFSVEKKLELVNQVRSTYHQNQSDLMNREMLLYGRTYPKKEEATIEYDRQREYYNHTHQESEEGIFRDGTAKIRWMLAAVFLMTVILFDRNGKCIAGISMERVFAMIETDYEESVDTLIEAMSISVFQ